MVSAKRWNVTYTKHLKQKRKVYQDGILELNSSGDKIRLYDESENLIESKFMRKEEVIESGTTLTMEAHLVDIGDSVTVTVSVTDSVGDHKKPPHPMNHTTASTHLDMKEKRKGTLNRKPLQKVNVSNIMQQNRIKVISNKSESGAPQSSSPCTPGPPRSTLKEWNVLYTTQLTQKAKKYHDGILRLIQFGSHAKQVVLYDESERMLESKLLKKEEAVDCGKMLAMDAHLVDIGDLKPIILIPIPPPPPPSPVIIINDDTTTTTTKASRKTECGTPRSPPYSPHSILKEWNVLYTSQLTQKAKKYHDGILRLSQVGSHAKQVILLNEEGAALSSRYLKSSVESVESGSRLDLPNYLVEVSEPRFQHEEAKVKPPLVVPVVRPNSKAFRTSHHSKEEAKEGELEKRSAVHVASSSTNGSSNKQTGSKFNSINNHLINAPHRDACQILSILKKPRTEEEARKCDQKEVLISSINLEKEDAKPEPQLMNMKPLDHSSSSDHQLSRDSEALAKTSDLNSFDKMIRADFMDEELLKGETRCLNSTSITTSTAETGVVAGISSSNEGKSNYTGPEDYTENGKEGGGGDKVEFSNSAVAAAAATKRENPETQHGLTNGWYTDMDDCPSFDLGF